jgi:hypothetical protein
MVVTSKTTELGSDAKLGGDPVIEIAHLKSQVSARSKKLADLVRKEPFSTRELRQVEAATSVDFDQDGSLLRDGDVHRLVTHRLKYRGTATSQIQNLIPHRDDLAEQWLAGFRMCCVICRTQGVFGPDAQDLSIFCIELAG